MVANPDHTPPQVLAAIDTLATYLRQRRYVEVVISDRGGAVFRLTSIHQCLGEMYQLLIEMNADGCPTCGGSDYLEDGEDAAIDCPQCG